MKIRFIILVSSFLLLFNGLGQNKYVDSLQNRLATVKNNKQKIDLLNLLAAEYLYVDIEKVPNTAQQLKELSIQAKNQLGEAASYTLMGNYYYFKNNYSQGLEFYNKALNIHQKLNSEGDLASDYLNIGNLYESMGKMDKALKSYLSALKIDEKIGEKSILSDDFTNLGIFYFHLNNQETALAYYEKALAIDLELGDERRIISSYINLGSFYHSTHDLKKSIWYHQEALKIAERIGYLDALGKITNNLGELHMQTKDYTAALQTLNRSLEIKKKLDNQEGLATAYLNIGAVFQQLKKYPEAIENVKQSLQIAEKTAYSDGILDASLLLSQIYNDKNDYKSGFDYYKKYADLQHELVNEASLKEIAEISAKYETEKKEQQIKLLTKEDANKKLQLQSQNNLIWMLIFSALFLLSFVFILYLRYRQKQKKILAKQMLDDQAMRYSSVVEAQETEKLRIARDLHDGVCQKFAATKMRFSNLNDEIIKFIPDKASNYKDCMRLLDEATSELRTVAHEIMPPALQQHDLLQALKYLTDETFESNIEYTYEAFGKLDPISTLLEINIYRIAQELFANVIKHSAATEVSVQVLSSPTRISLLVEDNGKGLTLGKITGVGINNINTRTQMLNGTFHLEPSPTGGTIASLMVDIHNESTAKKYGAN